MYLSISMVSRITMTLTIVVLALYFITFFKFFKKVATCRNAVVKSGLFGKTGAFLSHKCDSKREFSHHASLSLTALERVCKQSQNYNTIHNNKLTLQQNQLTTLFLPKHSSSSSLKIICPYMEC